MDRRAYTLYLLSFMMPMTTLLISVALPSMAQEYKHIDNINFYLKMIMVSPALVMFLLAPFVSEIAMRFGYKRVLVVALFVYTLSGMVGFFVTSLEIILGSRLLLGLGAAVIASIPVMLSVLYFSGDELDNFLGHRSSFLSLGATGATVIGGILSEFGWKYAFMGYALGFVALFMAIYFLPSPKREGQKEESISSLSVIKKAFKPYALVLLMMMLFYLLPIHLPFIMITEMGLTPMVVGVSLGLVAVISAYVSHRYVDIKNLLSLKMEFIIFYSLLGVAYIILFGAVNFLSQTYVAFFMIVSAVVLIGLGVGLFRPLSYQLVLEALDKKEHQKGLSLYVSILSLTIFITPLFMEPLIQLVGDRNLFLLLGVAFILLALRIGLKSLHANNNAL